MTEAEVLALAMQDCSCFTEDDAEKWAPHVAGALADRGWTLIGPEPDGLIGDLCWTCGRHCGHINNGQSDSGGER